MALGDVVTAASSAQGSLKALIRASLREENDIPFHTDKSYLRVSALANMCPREEVIAASRLIVRKDVIDADLKLIFAHGTGLHHVLQNEVLAETGALLGVWKCVDCAAQYGKLEGDIAVSQTLVRRPAKCKKCKSEEFFYREQHFINEEYRIGGHPDGFLVLQGYPGLGIVECKSISSRRVWEVKHTPDMGHVVQAQAYMWLSGLKWAKILYWEKGGFGATALTEHTVERDEEAIASIKSMIRSIWQGIEGGILPERICENATCPRAKKCPLVSTCFEAL